MNTTVENQGIKSKLGEYLRRWGFTSIKLNVGFAEAEFSLDDNDRSAAWDLYVELLTRIATQPLPDEVGDEEAALNSIHRLFELTREILHEKGRKAKTFTKISIIVLNQIVRPFTAKWHRLKVSGAFADPEQCKNFRNELRDLQKQLIQYAKMLADLAGVEDLTEMVD